MSSTWSKTHDSQSQIGERVRYARHRKGIGVNELAKIVRTSNTTISRIENGHTKASSLLDKIAEALDVQPYWIRYGQLVDSPMLPGGTHHQKMNANTSQSEVNHNREIIMIKHLVGAAEEDRRPIDGNTLPIPAFLLPPGIPPHELGLLDISTTRRLIVRHNTASPPIPEDGRHFAAAWHGVLTDGRLHAGPAGLRLVRGSFVDDIPASEIGKSFRLIGEVMVVIERT